MAAVFPLHFHARIARSRPSETSELDGLGMLDVPDLERRLSAAFLARYGPDVGREVTSETLAYAWEHRERLAEMDNPAGYLFRVGQSKSRRLLRWSKEALRFPDEVPEQHQPWVEPGLGEALAKLDAEQREIVILVHCFQWTYREVAELLGVELHSVRNRLHRGLSRLRAELGVAP